MSFDRMGRRVEYLETVDIDGITTTNTHHRFVYDGYLCIQRLSAAANNSIDLIFAWDPVEPVATRPLMIEKPNVCMLHVTHDGNKNVSDLVFFKNGSGVAAHYEYAPFGALTASTRNSTSTAYDFRTYNPFRFSSEYADNTLGLVYYNYRHYEPVMGRWLSRDPLEEQHGINLMAYIKNKVSDVDILGLSSSGICCQDFLDKVKRGEVEGSYDLIYVILNLNLSVAEVGKDNICKIQVKCEKCNSDKSRSGKSSNKGGYTLYNERFRLFGPNDIEISISICTDDAGRTFGDLKTTAAILNHELTHANDLCKQKRDFDCGEFTLASLNSGVFDARICSEIHAYAQQNRGLGEGLDKKSVVEGAVRSVLSGCKILDAKHVDDGFASKLEKRVESMYDRCRN